MGMVYKLNETIATPGNAAGGYYNMFYHWGFRAQCDQTENAVVFYMSDTDIPAQQALLCDPCVEAEPVSLSAGTPKKATK